MSQTPKQPLYTLGNKPFNAKPGDWMVQDGKGVTWGVPKESFHDTYWEVQPRSALGRLLGGRAYPTNEAVDTYLKTHKIGE